jgi:hypothetical protein
LIFFAQPDGFGVEQYPNGALYFGQFSNDLRHGLGKYVSKDSVVWSKWKDGYQYGVCIVETVEGGVTFLDYDERLPLPQLLIPNKLNAASN